MASDRQATGQVRRWTILGMWLPRGLPEVRRGPDLDRDEREDVVSVSDLQRAIEMLKGQCEGDRSAAPEAREGARLVLDAVLDVLDGGGD